MQTRVKHTIRNVLVATVACGLFVSGCADKDAKMQQPRADTSSLRAPAKNPGMKAAIASKIQEDELVQVISGEEQEVVYEAEEIELASSQSSYQPAPQQKKGWFGRGDETVAPSPHAQMERKVPMLNSNPSADYQAMAAPAAVAGVEMEEIALASPYASQVVVAEEVAMFQESYVPPAAAQKPSYPQLSSVPARPERLDAVQAADQKMAQMQQEQQQTQQQVSVLEQQLAADAGESMLPGRAIPTAHHGDNGLNHGREVVIVEEAQPVPYNGEPVSFDVVESAQAELPTAQPWTPPAAAPVVEEEVFAVAAPAEPVIVEEMVTTQAPVDSRHAAVAPQTDEWVSLQADPAEQMAQPMEQVAVAQAPDVAYVSDAVSPQAIQLTPPSAVVGVREQRVLPDSRYAARRQAVYAQRYNRVQLVDGN